MNIVSASSPFCAAILRRVWAKRGLRPVAVVHPRYQWRYLHGFVEPQSGRTFWYLTSWVDAQAFNLVLQQFAAWCGAGAETSILLDPLGVGSSGLAHRTRGCGAAGHYATVPAAVFSRTSTR